MSAVPGIQSCAQERRVLGFHRRALTADLRHSHGALRAEVATGTDGAGRRGITVRLCDSGPALTD